MNGRSRERIVAIAAAGSDIGLATGFRLVAEGAMVAGVNRPVDGGRSALRSGRPFRR